MNVYLFVGRDALTLVKGELEIEIETKDKELAELRGANDQMSEKAQLDITLVRDEYEAKIVAMQEEKKSCEQKIIDLESAIRETAVWVSSSLLYFWFLSKVIG